MLSAKLDRSRRYKKVHDWTLYVDVISGEADLIERVSFDFGEGFSPSVFHCAYPVPVKRPNGQDAWRFSTRQQTYGPVDAKIKIRGCGGSIMEFVYSVELSGRGGHKAETLVFREDRRPKAPTFTKLPDSTNFGIELELTSATHVSTYHIAQTLQSSANCAVDVIDSYSQAHNDTSYNWKLVPDGSIVCSTSLPDCNTFELVSPVLCGGNGLNQVSNVLRCLGNNIQPSLKVNKSMGFHVHIDVSTLSLSQLIKVCQNYIKYEAAIDTMMPRSRRTGSPQSDQYFQSNRRSVSHNNILTGRQCLAGLAACADTESLVRLMNDGNSRYYKLNMQNLVTGRQPTIEFRQHSGTMKYDKVSAWVRFCVLFVVNSAKLVAPGPFEANRSLDFQFEALFHYVIKDRALRNFYRQRRNALHHGGDDDDGDHGEACCSGCAVGGSCGKTSAPRQVFYF